MQYDYHATPIIIDWKLSFWNEQILTCRTEFCHSQNRNDLKLIKNRNRLISLVVEVAASIRNRKCVLWHLIALLPDSDP